MKKRRIKRFLAISLASAMVLSLAACGNGGDKKETGKGDETSQEKSTSGNKDLTSITVYPANATVSSGRLEGYKGDVFAEYGIAPEIWAYSEEKTNAILASGDLPDVMLIPTDKLDMMIESGLLLNLDDYLEQMPNVAESNAIMTAINYVKKYRSAGTGKIYCLPTRVNGEVIKYEDTGGNALKLNWDIYEEIGTPEMKDVWDVIPVMKQMLDAHPTNEAGEKCYGTFLNSGSDATYWGNMQFFFKWFGYEPTELPYLLEADMVNAKYSSILSKDSMYYEGLKWYNTVYREGLMDPDSINTDRSTQKAKVERGKLAMVPSGTVQGWVPTYLHYWLPDTKLYAGNWGTPYGDPNYVVGISADCKEVDAALSFLNALSSPDVLYQLRCGPEGEAWYMEDGVAHITDEAAEMIADGQTYVLENGEKLLDWGMTFVSEDVSTYMGPDGQHRSTGLDGWIEVTKIRNDNDTYKNWEKSFAGYKNFTEMLEANDAYCLESDLDFISGFASTPDDTMQLTIDSIRDTVVNASWNMVYTNSDEQFESIWDEMVKNCEELGAKGIINWRLAELEKAKVERDSLKAE